MPPFLLTIITFYFFSYIDRMAKNHRQVFWVTLGYLGLLGVFTLLFNPPSAIPSIIFPLILFLLIAAPFFFAFLLVLFAYRDTVFSFLLILLIGGFITSFVAQTVAGAVIGLLFGPAL